MIGAPLLVLGLLLVLSAVGGAPDRGRGRRSLAGFLLSPFDPATWRATAAILAGAALEVLAFSLVSGLLSAGLSLLVVGVGIVFLGLGVEAARLVARVERRRAAWLDGRPLRPHAYRPYGGGGLRPVLEALFLDGNRWRDVVYVFVALPLALLELVAVLVLWTIALVLLSVPLWFATTGLAGQAPAAGLDPAAAAAAAGIAGILLAPVAALASQGLMTLHRAVVTGLLCESERAALERRVERLEVSRQAVLDVEASELRRIERDLHDGAQQRLVMLTIQLGRAAERLEDDPAAARDLVVDAQAQARQALAELRDLVRGIAPAILLDRGLVPALSALAARSPVATAVESRLPEGTRLPDAVERAAYFVVAEALVNVAKHAGASRCRVLVSREGDRLVVEVRDDGSGGARVLPAGGLAGLAGRVGALDGRLAVTSPPGGPTVIRAELPAWPAGSAVPGWQVPPPAAPPPAGPPPAGPPPAGPPPAAPATPPPAPAPAQDPR